MGQNYGKKWFGEQARMHSFAKKPIHDMMKTVLIILPRYKMLFADD